MKPGREMDHLVDTVVMRNPPTEMPFDGPSYFDPRDYSTSIDSAWYITERMGAVFRLEKRWLSGREYWWCELSPDIGGGSVSATGESAPHAICEAALKHRQEAE